MRPPSPLPHLALPFALVGAAAGALFGGLLSNPLVRELPRSERWVAVPLAAVVGALVGAYLRRRCTARPTMWANVASVRVALLVSLVAGGALIGALVPCIAYGSGGDPLAGAGLGVLCALAFYPVAALVLAAATRAERARLGSWVAGSDRRAVWCILGTTLAVASLLGLADRPAAMDGADTVPWLPPAIAAIGAVGCVLAMAADRALLRRLRALECDDPHRTAIDESTRTVDVDDAALLDVGLGIEQHAQMAPGTHAYRTRERVLSVLVGSVATAREAVERSLLGGAVGLLLCLGALALHAQAGTLTALAAYRDALCHDGDVRACRHAADHELRGEAWASSAQNAAVLFTEACRRSDERACRSLSTMMELREATVGVEAAMHAVNSICRQPQQPECRRMVDLFLEREESDRRHALRALGKHYDSVCGLDPRACLELAVVRALPPNDAPLPAITRCLRGFAVDCQLAIDAGGPARAEGSVDAQDELRQLACLHGRGWACRVAGDALLSRARQLSGPLRGYELERRAEAMYAAACRTGDPEAPCAQWHRPGI